jgi:hypothetical protein
MTEAFLSYIWQYKHLQGRLLTTDGSEVEILDTGQINSDSGPDFFNAKIKINNTLWAGNVEIHKKSSDWNRHGHQNDVAYNNTILHVVFEEDIPIKTSDGNQPKCLEAKDKFSLSLLKSYDYLLHNANWIPCAKFLENTNEMIWKSWLERLAIERLEKKTKEVEAILESTQNDWEKAFFIFLASYFGQKVNKLPFQILARGLDLNVLAKHKNEIFQLEALLFGQAGLLGSNTNDSYHKSLKAEYHFLKSKYRWVPMPKHLWKYMRLRPASFPDVRIAQMANLLSKNDFLFSRILEKNDLISLEKMLESEASDYWTTHYRFGIESASKMKKLGKLSKQGLIINAIVPFLFVYGRLKSETKYEERAILLLSMLNPEKNKITRKFESLGKKAESAMESQAMIELKNNYCSFKKCLNCQIGKSILKPY